MEAITITRPIPDDDHSLEAEIARKLIGITYLEATSKYPYLHLTSDSSRGKRWVFVNVEQCKIIGVVFSCV